MSFFPRADFWLRCFFHFWLWLSLENGLGERSQLLPMREKGIVFIVLNDINWEFSTVFYSLFNDRPRPIDRHASFAWKLRRNLPNDLCASLKRREQFLLVLGGHFCVVSLLIASCFLSDDFETIQEVAEKGLHRRAPTFGVDVGQILLNWEPWFSSKHQEERREPVTGMNCHIVREFDPLEHAGPVWAKLVDALD